ncbi:DUF1707 domain-containing protein [Saccharomonospora azurea]|uniref:DUF1707 domain-containing protein n=1 Tax=Saccharomonospora azurea TaxID=40988 RepID=UPI0002400F7D|nr:DUF1707 domain-containing protein [Saccharomonospora azurea]EHK86640.1 hypothetical protein SZMC14600_14035 [Saccharomonospora azurea SZMC 14600]
MNGGPAEDGLRIGTAEREVASRLLADHFAEGRLTAAEYEDRVDRTLAARVRGDVRELFADLPPPHPPFLTAPESPHPAVRPEVGGMPTPLGTGAEMQHTETSDRSAVAAGVLQIALPFGTGRFYTGDTRVAVFQLVCTVLTFGLGALWPIIDGIMLLIEGGTDGEGRRLR